jgi:hypothetical protein
VADRLFYGVLLIKAVGVRRHAGIQSDGCADRTCENLAPNWVKTLS